MISLIVLEISTRNVGLLLLVDSYWDNYCYDYHYFY